jgi:hypothetical protein
LWTMECVSVANHKNCKKLTLEIVTQNVSSFKIFPGLDKQAIIGNFYQLFLLLCYSNHSKEIQSSIINRKFVPLWSDNYLKKNLPTNKQKCLAQAYFLCTQKCQNVCDDYVLDILPKLLAIVN